MNLVTLPDGRIINLDYLTHLERTGDYVILHLSGGGDGGSIVRVKQGEGARRVWAFIAGKCTQKIQTPAQQ
jgi:hydrogenase maturation factor